jgi:multiple sugar transport system substrate-binding protein
MFDATLSRRHLLRAGSLLVLAAPILAACAPAEPPTATPAPAKPAAPVAAPPQPTQPAAPAPAAATKPAAPAAAAPAGASPVTVSVYFPANLPDGQRYYSDIVLPAWAKAYPNIKLDFGMAPFGEWQTKLLAQIAGETVADVFLQDDIKIPAFSERGVLKDLTDYFKRDQARFKDAIRLEATRDQQGRQWSIPRNFFSTALLYNQDLFDKAGIKYPNDTWTWETFMDAARKLTKDKNGKGPADSGFDRKNVDTYGFWGRNYITSDWLPFVYQNKGTFLDSTRTKSNFDKPETVEAFEFMINMIHKENVSPKPDEVNAMGSQAHVAFLSQKVAMMNHLLGQEGSWAPELRTKFRFDAAVLPKGKERASSDLTHQIVLFGKAKQPDAAWTFTTWHTTEPEILTPIYTVANYGLPTLRSTWDSSAIVNSKPLIPNLKAFIDPVEKNYGHPLEPNAVWAEWYAAGVKALDLAYEGKKTTKEAMADAHREVQMVLDRYYKK